MQRTVIRLVIPVLVVVAVLSWPLLEGFSTLFLNSRIERLAETGLPKVQIEGGKVVHCRMKADDFRFPLPPGSSTEQLQLDAGGFDTVSGSVKVRFDHPGGMAVGEYQHWLTSRPQEGGSLNVEAVPGGLLIKFNYFGDK